VRGLRKKRASAFPSEAKGRRDGKAKKAKLQGKKKIRAVEAGAGRKKVRKIHFRPAEPGVGVLFFKSG